MTVLELVEQLKLLPADAEVGAFTDMRGEFIIVKFFGQFKVINVEGE